jgi:hypothetical protein
MSAAAPPPRIGGFPQSLLSLAVAVVTAVATAGQA